MLWEDDVNRMRRQASDREKIFAKDTSDQGLLSKINQKLLTLSNREQMTNRQLKKKKKKRTGDLNRYLSKRRYTDGK